MAWLASYRQIQFKLSLNETFKNMRSRPIENLENRWPKCKMHTQQRQLTRFCILQLIYKEIRTDGFSKPNRTRFSKPNRNRTELEKSIPHIPNHHHLYLLQYQWQAQSESWEADTASSADLLLTRQSVASFPSASVAARRQTLSQITVDTLSSNNQN